MLNAAKQSTISPLSTRNAQTPKRSLIEAMFQLVSIEELAAKNRELEKRLKQKCQLGYMTPVEYRPKKEAA